MTSTETFERDPTHWLYRLSPAEWIAAATAELKKAETAVELRDFPRLVAAAKRAAGMALNAALIVRPRETWGRTYLEHVAGLADEPRAPSPVRTAARLVQEARAPSSGLIALRSRREEEVLLEATRTVMAHAYAVVYGSHTREVT